MFKFSISNHQGCRMGAEAVMALMEADESEVPCVVSLDGNQVSFLHQFSSLSKKNSHIFHK